MSTQLSNLVYDLEHNALLAKQFMYSIVVAGVFHRRLRLLLCRADLVTGDWGLGIRR